MKLQVSNLSNPDLPAKARGSRESGTLSFGMAWGFRRSRPAVQKSELKVLAATFACDLRIGSCTGILLGGNSYLKFVD